MSPTEVTVKDLAKELTVCLVGMPNAGKTTLMNALTGGNFKTANYPGVTVSLLRGKSKPDLGAILNVVDLPGVHSSVEPSPEEELACTVIEGKHTRVRPDAFVLVVDATQLERHLKFAGFVARQEKAVLIALTMVDLLPRMNQSLDIAKLQSALGVPVIPVDGRTGSGLRELVDTIHKAAERPTLANALAMLPEDSVAAFDSVRDLLQKSGAIETRARARHEIDPLTVKLDRYALHRYWGFPIFFVALISLFAAIFWAAQPFMDAIDGLFQNAAQLFEGVFGSSLLVRFIAEGLIGGVGAVAVFFPQIMILFFLMTLLEDSGYLARGAALVDRPLAALGLHGRSFVPMLSGFACAIPAVFAARSIPSKRERFLTIWIIPLMSCSARLPVYALLLSALLPAAAWQAGLGLAGIYISSLLVGSIVAGIACRLVFKYRNPSLLAMELPVYRVPRWKAILRMTWARGSAYLKRAGVPIIVVSAILWTLSNFGPSSQTLISPTAMDESFAATLGQKMEPVLRPMGVDWRVGVGLISAFAAREVFVSSMAIVFHIEGDEATQQELLLERMRTATFPGSTQRIFTPASIIGLIVFFFFSLQCFSTVAVVKKETGTWKIAGAQLAFYTGLGYVLAIATVQGLRALGIA
jgi:ferrous iron transport protein B